MKVLGFNISLRNVWDLCIVPIMSAMQHGLDLDMRHK